MVLILGYVVEGIITGLIGLVATVSSVIQLRRSQSAAATVQPQSPSSSAATATAPQYMSAAAAAANARSIKWWFHRCSLCTGILFIVVSIDAHGSWLYPPLLVSLLLLHGYVSCVVGYASWI